MTIEIKADSELLEVLKGIQVGLNKLGLTSEVLVSPNKEEQSHSMTLEEFTAPTYTLKEVRAKLAALESSKAKELIASFGVKKLTDLSEEHYPAIMQKAGEV